ncbi:uncharacterized protein LAESUDRAFT_105000 [Laetiporus sulphureus 93-53]|uniref:Zn(2)-C6 fungal-type domain-containing protein n=1 Tax=Laetiporus sulphureus 93-53 TaxID=1314785 RepID=A0A165EU06_9APHY|nr:uncharacterized protein LAESUDRAFT_105000 [Laetiporus sulphureus 93-53]KZT07760.1 hypothetical protein LAESUDRAFT_105000 [Laetiporus sulphureus 93-53]
MNPVPYLQASSPYPEGMSMELDPSSEVDHRRRPRNRPAQSCLNCHISKRKCDRKRPCLRCTQLGVTGLCFYEVDDPALRDDPNIDENTRLRNRIAELESILRAYHGKPGPRWADTVYHGEDAREVWNSQARSHGSPSLQTQVVGGAQMTAQVRSVNASPVVKVEPIADEIQYQLYNLPSNGPSSVPQAQAAASHAYSHHDSSEFYPESYQTGLNDERSSDNYNFQRPSHESDAVPFTCRCLRNPALARPLTAFMTQLRATSQVLRHASGNHDPQDCLVLAHMVELDMIIRNGSPSYSTAYSSVPRVAERGVVMSPSSTLSYEVSSSVSWTTHSGGHTYLHPYGELSSETHRAQPSSQAR